MSFSSHASTLDWVLPTGGGVCWNLDPGYRSVLGEGRQGLWLCGLSSLQEIGAISLAFPEVKIASFSSSAYVYRWKAIHVRWNRTFWSHILAAFSWCN